jgi:hypothetical protein
MPVGSPHAYGAGRLLPLTPCNSRVEDWVRQASSLPVGEDGRPDGRKQQRGVQLSRAGGDASVSVHIRPKGTAATAGDDDEGGGAYTAWRGGATPRATSTKASKGRLYEEESESGSEAELSSHAAAGAKSGGASSGDGGSAFNAGSFHGSMVDGGSEMGASEAGGSASAGGYMGLGHEEDLAVDTRCARAWLLAGRWLQRHRSPGRKRPALMHTRRSCLAHPSCDAGAPSG